MRRSLFLESENATKVDKVYTFDFKRPHDSYINGFEIRNCVVNYSPTKQEVVTRAQISALSVVSFFDYTDSTKITESGDYVTQVNSQNSANVIWTFSSNTSHKLIDFGSGKAITSVAAWHWGGASSPTEKPANNSNEAHLALLFETDNSAQRRIFDDDSAFRDIFVSTLGVVWARKDDGLGNTDDVNYNVILSADTPYILSFTKAGDQYTCKAEQLTSPYTVQSDTQTHYTYSADNNANHKISWGDAQYGNQGFKFGSWVQIKGKGTNDVALIQKFLKQQYTGEGDLVSADAPVTLQLCSSYLASRRVAETLESLDGKHANSVEHVNYFKKINDDQQFYKLDLNPRSYETDRMKLRPVDIYFENRGTKVDVNNFSICLELYNTT